MISRPLDLASRLSPPPRRLEYVFFVNLGLIALMFLAFGSRFVLAPGLAGTFLPQAAGAREGAAPATAYVSIRASGQILTSDGLMSTDQLGAWLRARRARSATAFATKGVRPVLLILADAGLPTRNLAQIVSIASDAGYTSTVVAATAPASP